MEVIMALLMIVFGVFCIFIGGCIFSEMPALFGAELVIAGLCGLLMILSGLMCFACVTEM